jgi:hypothetical protein
VRSGAAGATTMKGYREESARLRKVYRGYFRKNSKGRHRIKSCVGKGRG